MSDKRKEKLIWILVIFSPVLFGVPIPILSTMYIMGYMGYSDEVMSYLFIPAYIIYAIIWSWLMKKASGKSFWK